MAVICLVLIIFFSDERGTEHRLFRYRLGARRLKNLWFPRKVWLGGQVEWRSKSQSGAKRLVPLKAKKCCF
jgi:hypothetical protein